ncbi:uncharacterized protein LOC143285006 [Babylonia areolata]|uniref:uncharacterized protein LOC143285006 n=1 Tax=Babylonia areolata TaxID=304850 RepID=UPI003FD0E916
MMKSVAPSALLLLLLLLLLVQMAASLLPQARGPGHVVRREAVRCASCEGARCVPPPPGCELGRRPCSCCFECRGREGAGCGPFTPECESHLVCHTYDGQMYVGRPPVHTLFSGTCVRSPAMPTASPLPLRAIGK